MRIFNSVSAVIATALLVGISAQSCSDELIQDDASGQLKMKMVVNSEVTRANVDDSQLAESCVIYISNTKGLIHKFKGIDNVPSDIWMKCGRYVAEAWAGDSVPASFDKKFYKAYEPFDLREGVNNVILNCKIANVVASVNRDRISSELLPAFSVNVGNTGGQLTFDAENINEAHGYFMMPTGETELRYSITGRNMLGTEFTKTGVIENVKPAHEYVLNLSYNENEDPTDVGGAFITVTVDDTELLIEDNITIHAAPNIGLLGRNIDMPVSGASNTFDDLLIVGACYGDFKNIYLTFSDKEKFGTAYADYDLMNLAEASETALRESGVSWQLSDSYEEGHKQLRAKIPAAMLNKLPNGSYEISVRAVDSRNYETEKVIKIEVSDAKVAPTAAEEYVINSYSALVAINVIDESAQNPGLRFRKVGDTEWTTAQAATRAAQVQFRLSGLIPATSYEVQATADGYVNTNSVKFTTEDIFSLPNASFEDWSVYNSPTSSTVKNIPFPGLGNMPTFWSSGNEGSMKMKKSITTQSSDMVHSGASSIKLASQFVGLGTIGKFAAGNVFSGDYVKTDGMDGVLNWGREMPKCHPVKLSGWANYRPRPVEYVEDGFTLISKGDMDKGTVYVAVVSEQREIRTKKDNRQLFDFNADYVLGYGQIIWSGDFGPDGQLQKFEVPIQWKNRAYSGKYYIVVVASASLYGDYFTGGPSVMYLDDLELSFD